MWIPAYLQETFIHVGIEFNGLVHLDSKTKGPLIHEELCALGNTFLKRYVSDDTQMCGVMCTLASVLS